LNYLEKRSFLAEKLGQRVCSPLITLVDDGRDPRGIPLGFDFEGVPRRRVELVCEGVAVGMVHNRRTAALMNPPTESTGHALPPGSSWGPIPAHLFLAPGRSSPAEMVGAVDRGLLVTRFHYTNMLFPTQTVLTGMTRDGTFLIEQGEVRGGVRNLRFTQSILEALDRVQAVGEEGELCEGAWAPPLLVEDFSFSGSTEF
jgi:predicted Zn-dependent protease